MTSGLPSGMGVAEGAAFVVGNTRFRRRDRRDLERGHRPERGGGLETSRQKGGGRCRSMSGWAEVRWWKT